MSIVINIFASIGLIVIISYIVYSLYKYISNIQMQTSISQINPPADYMQNTGVLCPDYWVNSGVDSHGNYVCTNSFNIQTNTTQHKQCKSDSMVFQPIKNGSTWEYNNPNGLISLSDDDKYNFLNSTSPTAPLSRCDWINKCGPVPNVQGVWSGVNEICNSPPSST